MKSDFKYQAAAARYIFLLTNGDIDSIYCTILSCCFGLCILIGITSSVIETLPQYRKVPSTCRFPVCHNDASLCPGYIVCEPVPLPAFAAVDAACIYIFTIEYFVKLLTAWAVDSREAEIIPWGWQGSDADPPPVFSISEHYCRYVTTPWSILDVLMIAPYYISMSKGTAVSILAFLRVFRLLRILRMFRLFHIIRQIREFKTMLGLIGIALQEAVPALSTLVGIMLLFMILFGSIVYEFEKGIFVVSEQFPTGAFTRRTINLAFQEVSPFVSIPTTFYWSLTTMATVGYGEVAPTSTIGRAVGCVMMLVAIIVLAMPLTAITTEFYRRYEELKRQEWERVEEALAGQSLLAGREGDGDEAKLCTIFDDIDSDKSGFVDIRELCAALEKLGVDTTVTFLAVKLGRASSTGSKQVSRKDFIKLFSDLFEHQARHANQLEEEEEEEEEEKENEKEEQKQQLQAVEIEVSSKAVAATEAPRSLASLGDLRPPIRADHEKSAHDTRCSNTSTPSLNSILSNGPLVDWWQALPSPPRAVSPGGSGGDGGGVTSTSAFGASRIHSVLFSPASRDNDLDPAVDRRREINNRERERVRGNDRGSRAINCMDLLKVSEPKSGHKATKTHLENLDVEVTVLLLKLQLKRMSLELDELSAELSTELC